MTTRRISSSRGIFRNCECATSRATISAWRTASRVSQNETFDSAASPSGRVLKIGIGDQDLLFSDARQLPGDLQRRALPQIVDIRLVGQSEAGDDRPFEPLGTFADLRDDEFRLGVIDLARGADQPGPFRR